MVVEPGTLRHRFGLRMRRRRTWLLCCGALTSILTGFGALLVTIGTPEEHPLGVVLLVGMACVVVGGGSPVVAPGPRGSWEERDVVLLKARRRCVVSLRVGLVAALALAVTSLALWWHEERAVVPADDTVAEQRHRGRLFLMGVLSFAAVPHVVRMLLGRQGWPTVTISAHGVEYRGLRGSVGFAWHEIDTIERDVGVPALVRVEGEGRVLRLWGPLFPGAHDQLLHELRRRWAAR